MREAPSSRFTLADKVPWEFRYDHGALWEITQHAGASDPIDYLVEAQRNGWSTCYMWEIAWAFSYSQRAHYAGMTWVKFLTLLPIGEDWVNLCLVLIKLVCAGMPQAPTQEEEAVSRALSAQNPQVPQPDGTGAIDSTQAP